MDTFAERVISVGRSEPKIALPVVGIPALQLLPVLKSDVPPIPVQVLAAKAAVGSYEKAQVSTINTGRTLFICGAPVQNDNNRLSFARSRQEPIAPLGNRMNASRPFHRHRSILCKAWEYM